MPSGVHDTVRVVQGEMGSPFSQPDCCSGDHRHVMGTAGSQYSGVKGANSCPGKAGSVPAMNWFANSHFGKGDWVAEIDDVMVEDDDDVELEDDVSDEVDEEEEVDVEENVDVFEVVEVEVDVPVDVRVELRVLRDERVELEVELLVDVDVLEDEDDDVEVYDLVDDFVRTFGMHVSQTLRSLEMTPSSRHDVPRPSAVNGPHVPSALHVTNPSAQGERGCRRRGGCVVLQCGELDTNPYPWSYISEFPGRNLGSRAYAMSLVIRTDCRELWYGYAWVDRAGRNNALGSSRGEFPRSCAKGCEERKLTQLCKRHSLQ